MAKHEFGIMQDAPEKETRYDRYEPQKYNCISVDDEDLEDIVSNFSPIDVYWHTLDAPAKEIAYAGITLIPPTSAPALLERIRDVDGLAELKERLEKAHAEGKWVIHFGL